MTGASNVDFRLWGTFRTCRDSLTPRLYISRVNTSVRDDVVNLTARSTDVHQLPIAQIRQGGAQFPAVAPLLKSIPVSPDEAGGIPFRCGCPFQPRCAIGRTHCCVSSRRCFRPSKMPTDIQACLTGGLHFPHRRLILCVPCRCWWGRERVIEGMRLAGVPEG